MTRGTWKPPDSNVPWKAGMNHPNPFGVFPAASGAKSRNTKISHDMRSARTKHDSRTKKYMINTICGWIIIMCVIYIYIWYILCIYIIYTVYIYIIYTVYIYMYIYNICCTYNIWEALPQLLGKLMWLGLPRSHKMPFAHPSGHDHQTRCAT